MQVSFTHPHPILKPYVEGYYYIALDCSSSDPLDIHPIGYNTIAFTLNPQAVFKPDSGSDYNFNLSYHGYISKYISLIPLQAFIKMIVVSFTTNGASQLFGISQPELINQIIPIEDVISGSGTLKEKLEENMSCERKAISSIERWLLEQLPKKEPSRYAQNIDYACNLIQLRYGNIRIADLCLEVNMSQTNLEDHFKQMIGISPKHYCRIIRFIAAYRFILNNSHIDWSALVHRYIFFDQAHFIHDFKTFFGYSPSKIHLANAHLAKGLTLEI